MAKIDFDYSFVIRTVGTAGAKYQALLNAIEHLTIKPREVLIVLPEGYEPPPERLGWERFIYTPKGMIAQRAFCLDEIKTEYALFSDDDWTFEPSLVEKLIIPILEGRADVTFPIFPGLLPQGFLRRFVMASIGSAVPIIFPGRRFTKILSSGSYAYNPHIKKTSKGEFIAETAPGLCFLTSVLHMKELHFEEEMWIDKAKYSWGEDQAMFYKLFLQGKKIVGVAGMDFTHLDAGSSSPERKKNVAYAQGYFRYVFWHRFIYDLRTTPLQRKLAKIHFQWMLLRGRLYSLILRLARPNKEIDRYGAKGREDAIIFVNSERYKSLPKITNKFK